MKFRISWEHFLILNLTRCQRATDMEGLWESNRTLRYTTEISDSHALFWRKLFIHWLPELMARWFLCKSNLINNLLENKEGSQTCQNVNTHTSLQPVSSKGNRTSQLISIPLFIPFFVLQVLFCIFICTLTWAWSLNCNTQANFSASGLKFYITRKQYLHVSTSPEVPCWLFSTAAHWWLKSPYP